jgi:membrane fusion protein (multidrug efflux system)
LLVQYLRACIRCLPAQVLLLALLAASPPTPAQTPPRPPVDVTVVDIKPQDTPVLYEYTGKTESSREVEIRARVSGYLEKIAYQEGSLVKQGQLLFEIDPRPFQAELDNAKGALGVEQAKLDNARATLNRVKPLARENAISQKDLDDATAAVLAAQASVQSAKAQVQQAEINLGYTTIRSPLSGLSGRSQKKEGGLVSTGDSLLTTIYKIDPIWVNFGIGENEMLRFREQRASGALRAPGIGGIQVEVIQADGSVYPQKGRIDYVAPNVDRETGTLAMRASIPNDKGVLSPGQFVRVRIQGVTRPNVIMVPQRSVLQGPQGKYVFVVGPDNTAQTRSIEVGDWLGDQWIVQSGLQAGDKVVVDGAIRLQPGAPVKITGVPAAPQAAK